MGFQCAPQLIGLVRGDGNGKVGAGGRANGLPILQEMMDERFSKSRTLDRTRSHLNEYEGFRTGLRAWEAMEADADAYRYEVEGRARDGTPVTRTRGLRKDAVIGIAVIMHPPAEVSAAWGEERTARFLDDAWEALAECDDVYAQRNRRCRARHLDEDGPHDHAAFDALDADGRYRGSDALSPSRVRHVNETFPRLMRERGWDVDDMDLYDKRRAGADPAYRRRFRAKARRQGLSVNDHAAEAADREAEAALEAAVAAELAAAEAERDRAEAEAEAGRAREEAAEGLDEARRRLTEARRESFASMYVRFASYVRRVDPRLADALDAARRHVGAFLSSLGDAARSRLRDLDARGREIGRAMAGGATPTGGRRREREREHGL